MAIRTPARLIFATLDARLHPLTYICLDSFCHTQVLTLTLVQLSPGASVRTGKAHITSVVSMSIGI